ncbi:hypothetical protein [Luteolibacter sp. LG18]|uniref:hypothetical protein n=1 Tax=Luteolibacter sp. LG18 TaxID=2819286 RepID=UPI002B3141CC|nr:hypothetical protein llg_07130 [Luteolibacter sp. LG18]BCU79658.1 hypothetical protein llg_43730 [Luteolibacter sp. LG18]
MNPQRTSQIRKSILTALKRADGYALVDESLRSHVNGLTRPPIEDDEWTEHIQWLEETKRIVKVPCEIDETIVQWAITERGEGLLAKFN